MKDGGLQICRFLFFKATDVKEGKQQSKQWDVLMLHENVVNISVILSWTITFDGLHLFQKWSTLPILNATVSVVIKAAAALKMMYYVHTEEQILNNLYTIMSSTYLGCISESLSMWMCRFWEQTTSQDHNNINHRHTEERVRGWLKDRRNVNRGIDFKSFSCTTEFRKHRIWEIFLLLAFSVVFSGRVLEQTTSLTHWERTKKTKIKKQWDLFFFLMKHLSAFYSGAKLMKIQWNIFRFFLFFLCWWYQRQVISGFFPTHTLWSIFSKELNPHLNSCPAAFSTTPTS